MIIDLKTKTMKTKRNLIQVFWLGNRPLETDYHISQNRMFDAVTSPT